ncbi:MAG: nucleoside triphosphate pyrophosphohydrolase [Thermodesulfobacteriota bacterium]
MSENAAATPDEQENARALAEVLGVVRALIAENGCPWDRQQTPHSLADYILEEGHELVEALRADAAMPSPAEAAGPTPGHAKAVAEVAEELGDLAFLLFFIATLYERSGRLTLAQALRANAAKMVRRHPHVFGDLELADRDELLRNWERIKREEKTENGRAPGVFDSLPKGLPPLLRAYRIHSKAARVGFTWDSDQDALGQYRREWAEWEEARAAADPERMEREFGDVLFTLAELGRRAGIKANAALDHANRKFLARFEAMERLARERGLDLPGLSLEEKNRLWDEAKAGEGRD